jgi:pantoate--beta-alanine ligase
MYIFKKVADLQEYLTPQREKGQKIGFVPTMGALHEGHISLIEAANESCNITVCSIFVNPTQFDNAEDLQKYTRNVPKDAEMLGKADTDVLFVPSVQEIYPPDLETAVHLDFGGLTSVMEGRYRKGHFEGMVQVVSRLLNITAPDSLFMGQKDFQQVSIVNNMLKQQGRDIELVICPIIREDHGLAMSSRNTRLSAADRALAKVIHETLLQTKERISSVPFDQLKKEAIQNLEAAGFRPDYFEIVDGDSLQHLDQFADSNYIVACIAAYLKDVRLIDNMILKTNN